MNKYFKTLYYIGILIILLPNLYANKKINSSNIENTFMQNSLIPTFKYSAFQKLPIEGKLRSDNFYSNPYNIFFVIIRNLSKNITKDLFKYKNKNIEIKTYSLTDRIRSEIFPYAEQFESKGVVIMSENDVIGLCSININLISSLNGENFINYNISEENLERFFNNYNSIKITKRDIFLKSLPPEQIIKEMINNINTKSMNEFYSCFSFKYKLQEVIQNFLQTDSLHYNPDKTFLGDIKENQIINIDSIESQLYTGQSNLTVYSVKLTTKKINGEQITTKYFIFLNYSEKFGYRIYDIKKTI